MSESSQNLTGLVALVTGASKGIGAEIAKRLAAQGASVVVNYSASRGAAEAVVLQIRQAGGTATAVQANVAVPSEIEKLLAETKSTFGRLDILVNNAGIYEFGNLEEITPEHFHKQFDLNVLGLILTTQEAVKLMGDSGGSIINISSVVGVHPLPGASVYSATKGAVDAVTKSLARELGPRKIRVNSVNPGMIDTEGAQSAGIIGSDFQKQVIAQTPLGRIGQPDDVARVVAFLASDDSRWVTGETLLVSGGMK